MNDQLRAITEAFNECIKKCENLCFITRGAELQSEAMRAAKECKAKVTDLKAQCVANADEDAANRLLAYELMLDAVASDLRLWMALKEDKADEGWGRLIDAQYFAKDAMRAHKCAGHLTGYIERLEILEELLFPPQKFVSSEAIIKRSVCSICSVEYGECDHVKGLAYMGQMCCEIVEDCEFTGMAFVKVPASKRCRITLLSDGEVMRNVLTGRIVPNSASESHTDKAPR